MLPRFTRTLTLILALVTSTPRAQAAGEDVTLKGELVDLTCYLNRPQMGKGAAHAGCARKCLGNGLPAGLLTDEGLYLLIDHSTGNVGQEFGHLAGETLEIRGQVKNLDGMRALSIVEVVGEHAHDDHHGSHGSTGGHGHGHGSGGHDH